MKLYELSIGQRFTFVGKYRGRIFEVIVRQQHLIIYQDTATGEKKHTWSNRVMFRSDVWIESNEKAFALNDDEIRMIISALYTAYLESSDENERSRINQLNLKLTGHPGRIVDVPEDVNPSPNVGE
ncbi:hypothetical protein [Parapedobacter lycopersici]|uniref:hypothetical protein n=1 Tax=Parapedobacter lycopersici TaxID=1864939 RepID=UPI00214D34F2|nr:hypothetical protein [Parapedobacter lycopersici]